VSDAELMEQSLLAIADVDIRLPIFERFFAAWPERRATFLALDASSRRMTDETIQMMFGLAQDAHWVWPLVCDLVFSHRSYGYLPFAEYESFIDLTVEELLAAAGSEAPEGCRAAWETQAEALKAMIDKARHEWTEAIPGAPLPG
jgi:hypothetical protein